MFEYNAVCSLKNYYFKLKIVWKILFRENPTLDQIKEQLHELLNADYDYHYLAKIQSILSKILQ